MLCVFPSDLSSKFLLESSIGSWILFRVTSKFCPRAGDLLFAAGLKLTPCNPASVYTPVLFCTHIAWCNSDQKEFTELWTPNSINPSKAWILNNACWDSSPSERHRSPSLLSSTSLLIPFPRAGFMALVFRTLALPRYPTGFRFRSKHCGTSLHILFSELFSTGL